MTEKSLLSRLSTHLNRPPGNPCQDYTISSSGGDDDHLEDGSYNGGGGGDDEDVDT